jgi:hypothetical protein
MTHDQVKAWQQKRLEEERRWKQEAQAEKQLHIKTRSNILLKYFSEKVNPGLYEITGKKESWGIWRERWIHGKFAEREEKMKNAVKVYQTRKIEQDKIQRELHAKTRSGMLVKYFWPRSLANFRKIYESF